MHRTVVGPPADRSGPPTEGQGQSAQPSTVPTAPSPHSLAVAGPWPTPRRRAPRSLGNASRVHLRELLASALVGIETRRRVDPDHAGRIRVTSATGGGPLVVRDDGVGFTPQEVRWLVATPDLESHGPGREGMRRYESALLACFQVADVVELRTRSALVPGDLTLRWVGLPNGTVRVTLADEPLDTPGTEVRLHPRAATRSWCTPETTLAHVRDVAGQLPVVIEVDGAEVSAGASERGPSVESRLGRGHRRLAVRTVLTVCPG